MVLQNISLRDCLADDGGILSTLTRCKLKIGIFPKVLQKVATTVFLLKSEGF